MNHTAALDLVLDLVWMLLLHALAAIADQVTVCSVLQVATMNARWLMLLLAVAVVNAQLVEKQEIPSGYGSAAAASEEL
jgi:hypothetical protein